MTEAERIREFERRQIARDVPDLSGLRGRAYIEARVAVERSKAERAERGDR